ncbi:hypothetical protein NW768_011422 [Fusarium equiseti]|uniref:Uncharacterized protein n=1 Tax=Fusarium equiseti TaxID=61235 RepID=A0ABQ8QXH1_FUSEQ|nr:hypothetical protein NW768_011422 [Fusarium equiseti]
MVYYAFLKFTGNQATNRWLITAPNPEAVDEWWREASEKFEVKRLSPDFYTYTNGTVWTFAPDASLKIFFTLMYDRDSRIALTFHQPERTDVVSGNAYYVRSKTSKDLYWLESGGLIYASKAGRTRFVIRITGQQNGEKNNIVVIDKDSISLGAMSKKGIRYVSTNDDGELVLSGRSGNMFYGDLKKNFLAQGQPGETETIQVTQAIGYGEEWELVQ